MSYSGRQSGLGAIPPRTYTPSQSAAYDSYVKYGAGTSPTLKVFAAAVVRGFVPSSLAGLDTLLGWMQLGMVGVQNAGQYDLAAFLAKTGNVPFAKALEMAGRAGGGSSGTSYLPHPNPQAVAAYEAEYGQRAPMWSPGLYQWINDLKALGASTGTVIAPTTNVGPVLDPHRLLGTKPEYAVLDAKPTQAIAVRYYDYYADGRKVLRQDWSSHTGTVLYPSPDLQAPTRRVSDYPEPDRSALLQIAARVTGTPRPMPAPVTTVVAPTGGGGSGVNPWIDVTARPPSIGPAMTPGPFFPVGHGPINVAIPQPAGGSPLGPPAGTPVSTTVVPLTPGAAPPLSVGEPEQPLQAGIGGGWVLWAAIAGLGLALLSRKRARA